MSICRFHMLYVIDHTMCNVHRYTEYSFILNDEQYEHFACCSDSIFPQ